VANLDPGIHQPTRLRIVSLLSGLGRADFNFLLSTLALTEGNLSSHMSRLQEVGYVDAIKDLDGRTPRTSYRLTRRGRARLDQYWRAIDELRSGSGTRPSGES
jgi:DNA-binding transcriptional ArsR family regulator